MAYEIKTKPTDENVREYIESVENSRRKEDALTLLELFSRVTGEKAILWGNSIIGFGTYSYTTKSGCSGEWMVTGFAPRKQSMSLYLTCDVAQFEEQLSRLGKHKRGKGCLYVTNLNNIDLTVLEELIRLAMTETPGNSEDN